MDRLNWGCGPDVRPDWRNSDLVSWPGMTEGDHVGPIQVGLPWPDHSFGYVASHHVLQMLDWPDLVPALTELRRVTHPGGAIRLSVPDLMGAVEAYLHSRIAWFPIADTIEAGIDGKLCVYLTQAGATRSVFTARWLIELLDRAGWESPQLAWAGATVHGPPAICELDTRPGESIYVEARCE